MFRKNIKPVVLAGALALATAVSPVFAEGEKQVPSLTVNKELNVSEGNYTVDETFFYNVDFKGYYAYKGQEAATTPSVHPTPVSENENKLVVNTFAEGSKTLLTGSDTLTFDVNRAIPGVYTYDLYEPTGSVPGKKVTFDSTHYTVYVTVTNGANGVEVSGVQVQKVGEKGKNGELTFVNSLAEDKANALSISKTVTGSYGDKTEEFEFTGTITLPTNTVKDGSENNKYTVVLTQKETDEDGNVSYKLKTVELKSGDNVVTFYLKDGETVDFGTLPIGTTYSFDETIANSHGYNTTATAEKVENTTTSGIIGDDNDTDVVAYTNDKTENPVTGIITNNAPYIVLLGASGAGLAALAGSKKRSKK